MTGEVSSEAAASSSDQGAEIRLAKLAFRRVSRSIEKLTLPTEWEPAEDDGAQMTRQLRALNESITSLLTCCNLLEADEGTNRCPVTQLPTKRAAASQMSRTLRTGETATILELRIERRDFIRSRYGAATLNEVLLHFADLLNMRLAADADLFHWRDGTFVVVLVGDRQAKEGLDAMARELAQPATKHLSGRGRTILLRLAVKTKLQQVESNGETTTLFQMVEDALQRASSAAAITSRL